MTLLSGDLSFIFRVRSLNKMNITEFPHLIVWILQLERHHKLGTKYRVQQAQHPQLLEDLQNRTPQ